MKVCRREREIRGCRGERSGVAGEIIQERQGGEIRWCR